MLWIAAFAVYMLIGSVIIATDMRDEGTGLADALAEAPPALAVANLITLAATAPISELIEAVSPAD